VCSAWESVKELQYYCEELSFNYLYDFLRWSFLTNTKYVNSQYRILYNISKIQNKVVANF